MQKRKNGDERRQKKKDCHYAGIKWDGQLKTIGKKIFSDDVHDEQVYMLT